MKRKMLALLIALCLASVLLPAMAEGNLAGEWFAETFNTNGGSFPAEMFTTDSALTLSPDGSAALLGKTLFGGDFYGTWSYDGSGDVVLFQFPGGTGPANQETVQATLQDETHLRVPVDPEGKQSMIFSRSLTEYTAPAVKTADAMSDFEGEWEADFLDYGMYIPLETYNENVFVGKTNVHVSIQDGSLSVAFTMDGTTLPAYETTVTFEDGHLLAAPNDSHTGNFAFEEVFLMEDGSLMIPMTSGNAINDDTIIVNYYFSPAQ